MLDYSVALLANPAHEGDPKKAYAYLQSRGTLSISEIADHMVKHGCNYDRADIVAIITKLVSCIKELMEDSYRISLGDGTCSSPARAPEPPVSRPSPRTTSRRSA